MTEGADLVPQASLAGAKKWRRYRAYKDSGIEWLGEIPEHWEVRRLKRGYEVQLGKMLRNEPLSEQDTLEPYIRAANVYWEGIDISDIKEMWFSPGEKKQYEVSKGDLIVCEGGDVGRSAIWDGSITPIYIQNAVHRVRAKDGNLNKFLYYLMYTLKSCGYFDLLCDRATLAHLTREKLIRILLPFPPVSEQRAIINYLDHETAKIDALVATKERFIELLAEKRTALTSQAVTKGLDPNVPLKDSGVEWLGEIPEHWEIKKLKYVSKGKLQYGASEVAELNDLGLPRFIRITDINSDGSLKEETFKSLPEDVAQPFLLSESDILFARSGATVGKTFQYKTSWGKACFAGYLVRMRPDPEKVISDFVYYYTKSWYYESWIKSIFIQATIQNISAEKYQNLEIPIPPYSEQRAIAAYLDTETAKIDALITKTRESIEKLKEYRTALISAAVTGKINVREEAP